MDVCRNVWHFWNSTHRQILVFFSFLVMFHSIWWDNLIFPHPRVLSKRSSSLFLSQQNPDTERQKRKSGLARLVLRWWWVKASNEMGTRWFNTAKLCLAVIIWRGSCFFFHFFYNAENMWYKILTRATWKKNECEQKSCII